MVFSERPTSATKPRESPAGALEPVPVGQKSCHGSAGLRIQRRLPCTRRPAAVQRRARPRCAQLACNRAIMPCASGWRMLLHADSLWRATSIGGRPARRSGRGRRSSSHRTLRWRSCRRCGRRATASWSRAAPRRRARAPRRPLPSSCCRGWLFLGGAARYGAVGRCALRIPRCTSAPPGRPWRRTAQARRAPWCRRTRDSGRNRHRPGRRVAVAAYLGSLRRA